MGSGLATIGMEALADRAGKDLQATAENVWQPTVESDRHRASLRARR